MVKNGFSLAEALIVMAVISIFFALATKVIAVKPKSKLQKNPHGYFECYIDGTLKQRTVTEGVASVVADREGTCNFMPPTGVSFFNIHTSGNVYYSGFEPNINNAIQVVVNDTELALQNESGSSKFVFSMSEDANVDVARQNLITFLQVLYPDSEIYNNGSIRTGVIISW